MDESVTAATAFCRRHGLPPVDTLIIRILHLRWFASYIFNHSHLSALIKNLTFSRLLLMSLAAWWSCWSAGLRLERSISGTESTPRQLPASQSLTSWTTATCANESTSTKKRSGVPTVRAKGSSSTDTLVERYRSKPRGLSITPLWNNNWWTSSRSMAFQLSSMMTRTAMMMVMSMTVPLQFTTSSKGRHTEGSKPTSWTTRRDEVPPTPSTGIRMVFQLKIQVDVDRSPSRQVSQDRSLATLGYYQ